MILSRAVERIDHHGAALLALGISAVAIAYFATAYAACPAHLGRNRRVCAGRAQSLILPG